MLLRFGLKAFPFISFIRWSYSTCESMVGAPQGVVPDQWAIPPPRHWKSFLYWEIPPCDSHWLGCPPWKRNQMSYFWNNEVALLSSWRVAFLVSSSDEALVTHPHFKLPPQTLLLSISFVENDRPQRRLLYSKPHSLSEFILPEQLGPWNPALKQQLYIDKFKLIKTVNY